MMRPVLVTFHKRGHPGNQHRNQGREIQSVYFVARSSTRKAPAVQLKEDQILESVQTKVGMKKQRVEDEKANKTDEFIVYHRNEGTLKQRLVSTSELTSSSTKRS